jgi:hypothetical protein
MTDETVIRLVPPLLALQFASFGWRINREIAVGDAGRRTWLPLPDYINILSMLAVVSCAILTPSRWLHIIDCSGAEEVARSTRRISLGSRGKRYCLRQYRLFSRRLPDGFCDAELGHPPDRDRETYFWMRETSRTAPREALVVRAA